MADQITVYGSDWCHYTQDARQNLDDLGVAYRYVDVDQDPAAEQRIAGWNDGQAVRPTFDIGGDHFVNPDAEIVVYCMSEI